MLFNDSYISKPCNSIFTIYSEVIKKYLIGFTLSNIIILLSNYDQYFNTTVQLINMFEYKLFYFSMGEQTHTVLLQFRLYLMIIKQ